MRTILAAKQVFTDKGPMENAAVVIADGVIEAILPESTGAVTDFGDAAIMPSFIDVHIHGSAGHDVMEGTPAALDAIGNFLAGHGVGAYLATTVSAPLDRLLHSVDAIAALIEKKSATGAQPIGIHLEGPFISSVKCGAHPVADLQTPTIALFDRFWEASHGTLRLITIAPELPNAVEVIARARSLGVRVSLGHSNATRAETLAAIKAGATSATHVFNAMRALDHREPGILGAVLDEDVFCEFIADGIHVDPALARLLARMKAPAKLLLVTDAMSATGMPDGSYRLGDMTVDVKNGRCLHDGVLAGSVLTLDRAVANFTSFTGIDLAAAVAMATANPAALLDENSFGRLAVGRPANLTVRAADGRIVQTYANGEALLA